MATATMSPFALSEFERLRSVDPEIIELSVHVLGEQVRAVRWWIRKSGALGMSPNEAYAEGKREAVIQELYAIKYSISP